MPTHPYVVAAALACLLTCGDAATTEASTPSGWRSDHAHVHGSGHGLLVRLWDGDDWIRGAQLWRLDGLSAWLRSAGSSHACPPLARVAGVATVQCCHASIWLPPPRSTVASGLQWRWCPCVAVCLGCAGSAWTVWATRRRRV